MFGSLTKLPETSKSIVESIRFDRIGLKVDRPSVVNLFRCRYRVCSFSKPINDSDVRTVMSLSERSRSPTAAE